MIGQPVANRPIMIGLLTSNTTITFSLGKPVRNLHKAGKKFAQPKIRQCVGTVAPPLDPPLTMMSPSAGTASSYDAVVKYAAQKLVSGSNIKITLIQTFH